MRHLTLTVLVLAIGVTGVGLTQPHLARELHEAKANNDEDFLPPPDRIKWFSLGHTAATVDALWAKLLVEWGMRLTEKRPFPNVTRYLDTILALEPDYAPAFEYADTLILYRYDGGTEKDGRITREYLERGLKARPRDRAIWLHYGQFMAYGSASYIPAGPELDSWKREGALAMTKAIELGGDAYHSIATATLLANYVGRQEAILTLRRAYAMTDDPETRTDIDNKLTLLSSGLKDDLAMLERNRAHDDATFIDWRWRSSYPFVKRDMFMLMGPPTDPVRCAGVREPKPLQCRTAWDDVLPSQNNR